MLSTPSFAESVCFRPQKKTKYMLYGLGHSSLDLGLTFDGSPMSKEPFKGSME